MKEQVAAKLKEAEVAPKEKKIPEVSVEDDIRKRIPTKWREKVDEILGRDFECEVDDSAGGNFLIKIFSIFRALPSTRKELFEKGIKLLIDEPNLSRRESRPSTNYTSCQKLVAAERIAAIMAFCNKSIILLNSNEIEIGTGEIQIEEIAGGKEKYDTQEYEINEQLIREVISTGLFTLRGRDKMGWTHQTYLECLAAKYLTRNQLNEEQIYHLILISSFDERKIIPQLNETVGWLVNYMPSLFKKLMDLDPEVLLKSDVTLQDEKDRERLINSLLQLFDEQKLFDLNYSMKKYYHKLNHTKLASQLRPFITDKTKGWLVRHEAMDIAEACKYQELQGELYDVLSDELDSIGTRTKAGWALLEIADSDHKKRMKKLLFQDLTSDIDDEIKGILLTALWPRYLSASELFSNLNEPKNPNLIGAYSSFIHNHAFESLQKKDLSIALDWVSHQESVSGWNMHFLEDLIDSIMYMGWQNLEQKEVLHNYVFAAKHLLKKYRELISRKSNHKFYDELSSQTNKR
ncbi:hypothetical protein KJ628_05960, partial [Patescibacteria group bacterium]|nr:hypothetical protein [Patescibacteria group bacterium]